MHAYYSLLNFSSNVFSIYISSNDETTNTIHNYIIFFLVVPILLTPNTAGR